VFGIGTLAGCNPLPGPALDPLYLARGTQPGQAAPPTSTSTAAATPPKSAAITGARVWAGRYRDSRGEGELTFSLVRGESTLSGTWTLRTGGGGPITGMLETGGKRFELRMENVAPDCPGVFDGWVEISETALVGAYHGKDCEGPVSDGRLELRAR
jgi:hypothetical protein